MELKQVVTMVVPLEEGLGECEVGESSEGNSNDVIFEEPDSNHVESKSEVEELHDAATCTGDDIKGESTPFEEVLNCLVSRLGNYQGLKTVALKNLEVRQSLMKSS
ncbi:hypothetical protein Tco_1195609 [Tanacetum coccineum]